MNFSLLLALAGIVLWLLSSIHVGLSAIPIFFSIGAMVVGLSERQRYADKNRKLVPTIAVVLGGSTLACAVVFFALTQTTQQLATPANRKVPNIHPVSSVAWAANSSCSTTIVPGKSIGNLRLGMTPSDTKRALGGDAVQEFSFDPTRFAYKSYSFNVDPKTKKLTRIRIKDKRACVVLGTTQPVTKVTLAKAPYADCALERRDGGTAWKCNKTGIEFLWGGPRPSIDEFYVDVFPAASSAHQ